MRMLDRDNNSCFNSSADYVPGTYCPPFHDSLLCWPATVANSTAYKYCTANLSATAHRFCLPNGHWEPLTNYSACMKDLDFGDHKDETEDWQDHQDKSVETLLLVMFIGSIISLLVLAISLVIFLRFKSLQCHRTSIHKNLIMSFILRFLIVLAMLEPLVLKHFVWYRASEWFCRALVTIQQLSYVANFYWMLVEGLYLHLILVMRPLSHEKAPFMLFYFIGWVIPLLVAATWAVVMQVAHEDSCWNNNSRVPYIFIIYVPIMLALLVNLLILMNLVRIIIIKLSTGHATEQRRICRTIKSTVVLVFLLGIINLVFFLRISEGHSDATLVYRYVHAILPNCQGMFVALIYCGMNSEVRRVIRKRWRRFRDSRTMNSTGKRLRSSRTSVTLFVSSHHQCNGVEANVVEMHALKDPDGNRRSSHV